MITFERGVRERRKEERLFRKANFRVIKSIREYDFSQVVFLEDYTKDNLFSLEFLEKVQDFVFYGKTGRGKTHLAVAHGIHCVKQGLFKILRIISCNLIPGNKRDKAIPARLLRFIPLIGITAGKSDENTSLTEVRQGGYEFEQDAECRWLTRFQLH